MNASKTMLSLTFAVAVFSASLAAQQPERIKLATLLPRGTSGHQALLEMAAKWRPAGVTTTIYTDAAMGGEAETVRRMRVGQHQGAVLTAAGLLEIDRSAAALQITPMVFRSLDEVAYVRKNLRASLEKRFEEKGFVLLFLGDAGWVHFFSKKPVVRPDDMKKQKLFVLSSDSGQGDLIKTYGFQVVPLEYTDVLTGLQTGLIEAVPTVPFYALAGQFNLQAPYMLDMDYVPLIGGLVLTRKSWDALPAATQTLMRGAAEDAGAKITAQSHQEMQESVAAMQKRGLTVTKMTPQAEAEWRAIFENVNPKMRGTLMPAEVYDEVHRLVQEFRR